MRLYRQFACLVLALPAAAVASSNSQTPATCAQSHLRVLPQSETYMAHALEKVESSRILIDHPLLTVTVGKYSYRIERKGDRSEYSVTNGSDTLTLPIRWAMGADLAIGQTYIIEKDGELFESHVSWFGLTKLIGLSAEQPRTFCDQCHRTTEEIARQRQSGIANVRFQPYRLTGSKCYDPDDKRISCLACHDPYQQTTSKPIEHITNSWITGSKL